MILKTILWIINIYPIYSEGIKTDRNDPKYNYACYCRDVQYCILSK